MRSEAREGNNPDPISVATHSSDEMLPTTLATLREINRKLIAESLDVEPADDEKKLYAKKSPWETDTSISYTPQLNTTNGTQSSQR